MNFMMVSVRIIQENRTLGSLVMVAMLAAFLSQPAVAAPRPPLLHFSVAASTSCDDAVAPESSLECNARIEAGGAVVRLWTVQACEAETSTVSAASLPVSLDAGLAVSMPYLRFGATRPSGLSAFVHTPASADMLLLNQSGAPLVPENPEFPASLGISLGEDYGVMVQAPANPERLPDLDRVAWGAWFSPRSGFLSALAFVSGSPEVAGGPGWFDVPTPAATRALAALSGSAAGAGWAVAAGAAGSAGFPGQDAAACRAEISVTAGDFRLEATGAAASSAWTGPDGRSAPFLHLAADTRYSRLGYAAVLGFRYVQPDAPDHDVEVLGADVVWSGALEARSWFGLAKVAASLATGMRPLEAGTAAVMVVDTRWRPGFAPWLALASSWRVSGCDPERFDVLAQAFWGNETRISLDSGLRFVPEGRMVKAAFSIARTFGAIWLGCSVRTPGWVQPDTFWSDSLTYSIEVTATCK